MITRSKLVEQLRDYQIRSQHKYSALTIFSPKPYITTRVDVAVAVVFALMFCMLVVSSCLTLYFQRFWLFLVVVCLSTFLFIRLKLSRQSLARKRERRLPLSI
ncbi:Complement factor I light chain like [Senna tora]|uniref:Complement factor I light chain like n=1 Tax=Senna tora TaxID=362788 RepID=A0A834W4U5_9FABA|nr:Complement factor I light chain like [Senna tora]